jgi:microcystin-dependent protein
MANVPLVANPIFPPVPDEPQDVANLDSDAAQKVVDSVWKWMKDLTVQLKILFGSSQSSSPALTIPLVQAGSMIPFAGLLTNIPAGYLAADGSVVSQTQYPALFAAMGTSWNTGGEGPGNFRLPDMRGRVMVGSGTGTGLTPRSVGQYGGEETHLLTVPEIPAHNHPVSDPGHAHGVTDPGHAHTETGVPGTSVGGALAVAMITNTNIPANTANSGNSTLSNTTGVSVNSNTTGITDGNTGGGGAHNNMQPFGVFIFIIKF